MGIWLATVASIIVIIESMCPHTLPKPPCHSIIGVLSLSYGIDV